MTRTDRALARLELAGLVRQLDGRWYATEAGVQRVREIDGRQRRQGIARAAVRASRQRRRPVGKL